MVYAENWLQVDSNGEVIYIDRDSIRVNNGSLYYNIRCYDDNEKDESVVTIQSINDTAGSVAACSFSDDDYYKPLIITNPERNAKSLTHIDTNSALYNANMVANILNELNEENKGPDFDLYMKEFQNKIKKYWKPPKNKESKRVVLLLTVGKNGNLLSKRVLVTSGIPEVDEAAIQAVLSASPFAPLPKEYRGESVEIQFVFDYNVISGWRWHL